MKEYILIVIIIFLIVVGIYKIYDNVDELQLKCIISDIDGNKYCVRDRKKLKESADKLAHISICLDKIVEDCNKNYSEHEITKILKKKYNPQKIVETLPTSEFTAYSENKGEKLAFCLNKEKNEDDGKLIDDNTLLFVAIHELAHIGTKSIGHSDEFWNNFKFLLLRAQELRLYKIIDYKKQPQKYCGIDIKDNPVFDF